MRPVKKINWPHEGGISKPYKPHTLAKTDLELNLGNYCSYCEVFSSDLEVEHVISRNQDNSLANNWDNFLLACGRCNGRDNKSNKGVDLNALHFPHRNNTLLSFVYLEGGLVAINPKLRGISLTNAENTMNLIGLDKYPGNPRYPNFNSNDTRWRHRRTSWEWAVRKLSDYKNGKILEVHIVEFAIQRGFFSVWVSVFNEYPSVLKLLIESFIGTAQGCFDPENGYKPVYRNPDNLADPI